MSEKTTTKRYIETIGRRKTASARVRLTPSSKLSIEVNGKEHSAYFPTDEHRAIVIDPFTKGKIDPKFTITALVTGGGIHAQAEAIRHGISRAIVELDETQHTNIKKLGFLKRDPRAKERRKFGLKKARKSPQWSKR